MNKYFLICIISISLIIYTNSADCSTLTTDTTCKAQSGCKWTATATCRGDESYTSANTSKSDCEVVTYGEVTCVFKAECESCQPSVEGTDCTSGTDSEACGKIDKFAWTRTPDTCTGVTTCTSVQNPTSETCTAASVEATKCTYTAPGCSAEEKD